MNKLVFGKGHFLDKENTRLDILSSCHGFSSSGTLAASNGDFNPYKGNQQFCNSIEMQLQPGFTVTMLNLKYKHLCDLVCKYPVPSGNTLSSHATSAYIPLIIRVTKITPSVD